jgi:hypothetical protein
LITVGATLAPLNVAVVPAEEVCGKKKPPERVMFALEAIDDTLAGVEEITAGRTGATVKVAGGDVSPLLLRTTMFTAFACWSSADGIVTRSRVESINVGTMGTPSTSTTEVEKKSVPLATLPFM